MYNLLDYLKANGTLPMHMPGHKRNTRDFSYIKELGGDLDITEIDGFDDLHCADGILKTAMERAAKVRGCKRAFFSVNGATGAVLASVAACVGENDKVIVARNCHKSVYNALELSGAVPIYAMPERDSKTGEFAGVSCDEIERLFAENSDIRLVIVTSPTYTGIVSDLEGICKIAHKNNAAVLVDAAHGAHFGYGYGFPKSAVECGADISVESLHKTLPSLTQTALCCVVGDRIDEKRLENRFSVFETSSPSYLLMASIDCCMELLERDKDRFFSRWKSCLDKFSEETGTLKRLEILRNNGEYFDFDRSKMVILTHGIENVSDKLRNYGIECEMSSANYVIAMTGMGDTEESLEKLKNALFEIDKTAANAERMGFYPERPKTAMSIKQALKGEKEAVEISAAAGRIMSGYVYAYPPGIPILAAGDVIPHDFAEIAGEYEAAGIKLRGMENGKITVVKRES